MKAIIYNQYGSPDVLQLADLVKPIPGENEIRIKVIATSATAGDARMRKFDVPAGQWLFARLYLGVFKPRMNVLGMELSGIVDAVGNKVTRFKVGDNVIASTLNSNFGAYAEFKCLPEDASIALMPENLSHMEAATLPIGAGTALRFLRSAKINQRGNVLIYGAAGSVGTYAVQIAKYYGTKVTAVCGNASLSIVSKTNPDRIINYNDLGTCGKFDLIFDASGKGDKKQLRSLLNDNGTLVTVASNPGKITANDLTEIAGLVEAMKLQPVISRSFDLENVAEAHELVDSGQKKGNVSIRVANLN